MQISETELPNMNDVMSVMQLIADETTGSTAISYTKTIAAFRDFAISDECDGGTLSGDLLRRWITSLLNEDYSFSTVVYYFENLSAIYRKGVKRGDFQSMPELSEIRGELREMEKEASLSSLCFRQLPAIGNIARQNRNESAVLRLEKDLLLFYLCIGATSLDNVVAFSKDDTVTLNPDARSIAENYISSRRRYLFPLSQTSRNFRSTREEVVKKLKFLLSYYKVEVNGDIEEFLTGIWIAQALKCGYDPATVAGAVDHVPSSFISFRFVIPAHLPEDRKSEIRAVVASSLMANPLRWFAMKLRAGVTFEEVEKSIAHNSLTSMVASTFYPCMEIKKKIRKKVVTRRLPLINDVVFFQARITDVSAIFHKIGDLAWCYRLTGDTSRPYAAISDKAMSHFQRTIGIFSPDMDLAPLGTTPIGEGEMVRIVGGLMAGYVGMVYKVLDDKNDSRRRLFRLRLVDSDESCQTRNSSGHGQNASPFSSFGMEWTMEIDERLVEILK